MVKQSHTKFFDHQNIEIEFFFTIIYYECLVNDFMIDN